MKKTKLISLALAALMIVSIIPMGIFSASATEATATPAMPTTYPNGNTVNNIGYMPLFADFNEKITTTKNTSMAKIENGKWVSTSGTNDAFIWASPDAALTTRLAYGAAGIMFYLESSDDTKCSEFNISFNGTHKRYDAGTTSNGDVRFTTSVVDYNGGKVSVPGGVCTYYTYGENGWSKHEQKEGGNYFIGTFGDAWYYIPFTSFYYIYDDAGCVNKEDSAWGMNFVEFMEKYSDGTGLIWNMRIRQDKNLKNTDGTAMTLTFSDIYTIYPEYGFVSENASSAELLPNIKITNQENKNDNWSAVVSDGVLTIAGNTGNNSTSVSDKRVWLGSSTIKTRDLSTASGIRFYVDSSSLGTEQLLLRIRLKDTVEPDQISGGYTLLTNTKNGTTDFVTLEAANASQNNYTAIQYVTRTAGSTAYVYDADGNVVPCYGDATNLTAINTHADSIALPAGYKGYVYIPMDSFFASIGGSWHSKILVGFDKAVELGLAKTIDQIAIIQTYSDSTNAANYSVSYSDFEIVYEDIEVTQTAVSLGNDLALKVKAVTNNGATVESAAYTIDGNTYTAKVSTADGTATVICDGILPQDAGKTVKITVNGKVGDVAVSNTVETSVKDYCLKLIATKGVSDAAKNAAADLLRYAGAAQTFVAGGVANVTSPILDTAASTAVAALGQKTDFAALNLTSTANKSETTSAGYDMAGAALRLENALALKLFVTTPADSTAAVKASFELGDDEAVAVDVKDGIAVFGGIGACDLDTPLTVTLSVDGTDVQTLTYTVLTDYFAMALADSELTALEVDLVKALYDYGVSASAYADSLAS
ncbi:MAG: hypothetical protein IJ011_05680 [Clostridia bacterium]|nr:hypothetical protein [Clostridia bacterium]